MPPKHQDFRSVTPCLAWGVCLFGTQSALNKIGSPGLDLIGNIQDQSQLVSGFYCLPPSSLLFISIIQKDPLVFNQNFWFYFVCMGVLLACVYMWTTHVLQTWCLWKSEECIGSPGTGVVLVVVSHHGGTENQTCVFPQKQKVFLTTGLYITALLFGYLQQKSQRDFSLVKEIKDNLDFFPFYLVKDRY